MKGWLLVLPFAAGCSPQYTREQAKNCAAAESAGTAFWGSVAEDSPTHTRETALAALPVLIDRLKSFPPGSAGADEEIKGLISSATVFSCADLLVACSPSTPSPNRSSGNNALASPASAVPDRSAGLVAVNHVNESVGRLHEMTDGGQIEPWIHEEADWLAANPDAAATVAGYRQAVIEALQAYSQGGNSLQNQRNIERAAQMIPGVSID